MPMLVSVSETSKYVTCMHAWGYKLISTGFHSHQKTEIYVITPCAVSNTILINSKGHT